MDDFTWKSKKDLSNPSSVIFSAILDDKGRVVIPASIRNRFNLSLNSQVLLKLINGCSGVEENMEVCETSEAGAIPACNLFSDNYTDVRSKKTINNSSEKALCMKRKIKNLMLKYKVKNLRQLSEKMNVPYEIIKNWSCGRTTIGSVGKFKQVKIPRIIDYKLAELVGIVLGDGNICGNQLRIYGNKEEYEYYRNNIQKLLFDIFGVRSTIRQARRNSNGILLTVNSVLVCRYLKLIGLKDGSKIKNKATIPDWIYSKKEFIKCCLKGLFDTDGSFFSSSKDTEINILWNMGMNSFLPSEIRKMLIKLNYSPTRIFDKGRRLALCKRSEVIRFFKEIKPENNVQNDKFLKFFNESSNPARDLKKVKLWKILGHI